MDERITKLEGEMRTLKAQLESFQKIQNNKNLEGQGYVRTDRPNNPPTGYDSNSGFRRDVPLSGLGETITIPAYPIRFIKLANSEFYIPLHTFSQFGI